MGATKTTMRTTEIFRLADSRAVRAPRQVRVNGQRPGDPGNAARNGGGTCVSGGEAAGRGMTSPVAAASFSLMHAAWIPCVVTGAGTGEFTRVEGPWGFWSYDAAVEAARFLIPAIRDHRRPPRPRAR
jgi:hypothetical protein